MHTIGVCTSVIMEKKPVFEECSNVPSSKSSSKESEESSEEEYLEEEVNPLGLLEMVYTEENNECYENNAPANSTSCLGRKRSISNIGDNEEELEPVTAVDVSPESDEDLFPETVGNADGDPWGGERALPEDSELSQNIQENLCVKEQNLPEVNLKGIPPVSLKNTAYQSAMERENILAEFQPFSKKHASEPEKAVEMRRQYYQIYRQKNLEVVRARNREYARRYREMNRERLRLRQREYIQRMRERQNYVRKGPGGRKRIPIPGYDDMDCSGLSQQPKAVTLN